MSPFREPDLNNLIEKKDVKRLINVLKSRRYWAQFTRITTAKALGSIGDTRAIQPLIQALKHAIKYKDSHLQETIMQALVRIGSGSIDNLIDFLQGTNADIKLAIVNATGNISDESIIPLLKNLANSTKKPGSHKRLIQENKVRCLAIQTLSNIRDTQIIDLLIKALDDEEIDIRKAASRALKKITDENHGNDAGKWKNWWSKNKNDKQIMRNPLRLKRRQEWEKKKQRIEEKYKNVKPPSNVEVAIHRLLYGDYNFNPEAERKSLEKEVNIWKKSQNQQKETELLAVRAEMEKKWQAQEEAWHNEDNIGQPLNRCPCCHAELTKKFLVGRGRQKKCAFCGGSI